MCWMGVYVMCVVSMGLKGSEGDSFAVRKNVPVNGLRCGSYQAAAVILQSEQWQVALGYSCSLSKFPGVIFYQFHLCLDTRTMCHHKWK